MSRKPYECYVCQRNGFNGIMVYLAGKDENNKTIYLEEDGTKHFHKTKEKEQQPEQDRDDSPFAPVSDQSVQRGITAFTMMTDLIGLVEQTQKLLVTMDGKLDHLTKLVYAAAQQQEKQQS